MPLGQPTRILRTSCVGVVVEQTIESRHIRLGRVLRVTNLVLRALSAAAGVVLIGYFLWADDDPDSTLVVMGLGALSYLMLSLNAIREHIRSRLPEIYGRITGGHLINLRERKIVENKLEVSVHEIAELAKSKSKIEEIRSLDWHSVADDFEEFASLYRWRYLVGKIPRLV